MFKNSVLKASVNTKEWAKKAAIRAVKTMAQTAVAVIGTSTVVAAVDWKIVVSSAVVSGVVSILTSVAGIPVSIHAPLTGSDLPGLCQKRLLTDFNPRSPHRERLVTLIMWLFVPEFQSTLPSQGATIAHNLNNIIT